MIEVRNLSKTFDGFQALDGLSLTVPKGAVYGLVGPNGAGKSTLIRHLMGIYRPDSGEILIDGSPVYENTEVKARMAYIPDDIFFFHQSSVKDMMRYYRGIYPRFDMERYEKLKGVFSLDENMPIRRMSKGMQKQAAFWLSMCMRADILVLDEPVDGLDPVMRRQVWSILLSDVAENGTTVLVSSHNLRELEDICDHVGIMDKGQMLLERSLASMQGSTVKVQMVGDAPEGLEVLHSSSSGRLNTLVVRGAPEEIRAKVAACNPAYFDVLPLSLEEIFIYELGGVNYEVKDILL